MKDLSQMLFSELLDELGAKTPAPGGGAVGASAGALGASVARMVLSYSLGRRSLAEHQPFLEDAAHRLDRARELFLELACEDAAAYGALNELMRLDESEARRRKEYPEAVRAAVGVPMASLAASTDLLRLIESLVDRTNPRLASDLAIAAVMAEASARAAAWNVEVNLPLVSEASERARLHSEARAGVEDAKARREAVERACAGSA